MQGLEETLLATRIELIYSRLEQLPGRDGRVGIGADRRLDKAAPDQSLELRQNFLLNRFGRNPQNGYRDHDPANRDPGLVRRGLVGHCEQIERVFVQDAMLGLHAEQQEPNKGIAWRTGKGLSGATFERMDALIKFLHCS